MGLFPMPESPVVYYLQMCIRDRRNFHVDARVVQVTQGPTVTRFEIQPSAGVKVSKIVGLADDIALNLSLIHIWFAGDNQHKQRNLRA